MKNRIGFIQGRFSPIVNGKIQSFPWDHWREEFLKAEEFDFRLMEWTLDQHDLHLNPLLSKEGRSEINKLSLKHKIKIPSLTGDCFMQAPFWKAKGERNRILTEDFFTILDACKELSISSIVVPLVDNGRLENKAQQDYLLNFFKDHLQRFKLNNQRILFESDFAPIELAKFIERLDPSYFGINYDIGNSAALGFIPREEFQAYGFRIMNIHVKDREFGGTTVPLGQGNANFDLVFEELGKLGYQGNFILQTARASDANHALPLVKYRDMTVNWMKRFGLTPLE